MGDVIVLVTFVFVAGLLGAECYYLYTFTQPNYNQIQ